MRLLIVLILMLYCATSSNYVSADDHFVARQDVQAFITQMVKKHGFKKEQLMSLFSAVKIRPQVIRHVNKPLEKEPWHTYQMIFVNEWRIQHGVAYWNKHAAVLKKAEEEFGIPSSIIVATIGIETKYGQRIGDYRVIDSLTNLAFSESPRATFFRKELEEFLILTKEQHLDPLKIRGSYAGAIGQPQFMPSSYRHYAVNFSKSGKTDLMHNEVDIIGSIANYYQKHGWTRNDPIVVQAATVGDGYHYLTRNNPNNKTMSIAELSKYGLVPKTKVTNDGAKVKVIELQSRYNKEYWLGFHNFDVIKRYNSSDAYAMAIFQLSNYITALRERLNNGK